MGDTRPVTLDAPRKSRDDIERRTYDRVRIILELLVFLGGFGLLYLTMDRRVGAAESAIAEQGRGLNRLAGVPESLAELRAEQRATAASVQRIERAVEALGRPR